MGQSLTLQHGSWSPDLANNAIPVAPNQSVIEVPSADTLNVYYADGSFRNLPSPNPYAYGLGQLLSTSITTDTDGSNIGYGPAFGSIGNPVDSEGNTLTGLSANGTTLTLTIAGAQLGAAYFSSIAYASAGGTPTTLNASDAAYSFTSGTNNWVWTTSDSFMVGQSYGVIVSLFAGAQILNALTWYDTVQGQELLFAATADGLFELIDGVWGSIQPQVSVSVALSGVSMGMRLRGTMTLLGAKMAMKTGSVGIIGHIYDGTLVAGSSGNQVGFSSGAFGSLTPTADHNHNVIGSLYQANSGRAGVYSLILTINKTTLTQNYFSSLTVAGNGNAFQSGSATFGVIGSFVQWRWDQGATPGLILNPGSSYAVALEP